MVLTEGTIVTYQVFAIQPIAASILFNPGGAVDQIFGYTGAAAQDFTTSLYYNGGAGNFQANYFLTNLESRGLVNSAFGPELPHFPFYEDASVIHNAIQDVMTTFVYSYYSSASVLAADAELQAWAREANKAAGVIGFPQSITSAEILIDILTQMVSRRPAKAYLPASELSYDVSIQATWKHAHSLTLSPPKLLGPSCLDCPPHLQHQ